MRRLWLLFAQRVTVVLALYCVYAAVRPDGVLRVASRVEAIGSVASGPALVQATGSALAPGSYRNAAARAMPAVVNILASKALRRRHRPLLRDPFFKKFFGDRSEERRV